MKKTLSGLVTAYASALVLLSAPAAQAAPLNFSFSGQFSQDDNVRLINFTADGQSTVYLVSYAYGGGTQANGATFGAGGFDTILALFDSSGSYINQNDDGSPACFASAAATASGTVNGRADPNTGQLWDTCFSSTLAAGTYTVAVMEYNNFALGPNLSNGFARDGQGNFTATNDQCTQGAFCDVSATPSYTNRTNVWAYDVLNVSAAVVNPTPTPIPEPGSLLLVGLSLGVLAAVRRRAAR